MAGIVLREQSDAGGLFLQKITPQYKNALRTGFDFLMVRTLLHVCRLYTSDAADE